MTEPTYAELIDLWASFVGDPTPKLPLTNSDKVAFARAVLAKWGTPPAVAGEPVIFWDGAHAFSRTESFQCDKPLYTTPQPTQSQAGAVPLTREQVKAICVEAGYETAALQARADFINGLRHGEAAHGIKRGHQ